jgi:hypothetical protein
MKEALRLVPDLLVGGWTDAVCRSRGSGRPGKPIEIDRFRSGLSFRDALFVIPWHSLDIAASELVGRIHRPAVPRTIHFAVGEAKTTSILVSLGL